MCIYYNVRKTGTKEGVGALSASVQIRALLDKQACWFWAYSRFFYSYQSAFATLAVQQWVDLTRAKHVCSPSILMEQPTMPAPLMEMLQGKLSHGAPPGPTLMMSILAARATGASVLLIAEIQQQILQVQDNVVSALKLFWLIFCQRRIFHRRIWRKAKF